MGAVNFNLGKRLAPHKRKYKEAAVKNILNQ
jgi:hypothetical protein